MVLVAVAGAVLIVRRDVQDAPIYPAWQDPAVVDKLKIDPVLSAAMLAGTNDVSSIGQMLARGDADSAYAGAIYSPNLSDRQRLAELLLVGERYTAQAKADRARMAYQAAMDVDALSPSLSDFERADALAQMAGALYTLQDRNTARLALDSGRDIALRSPFLKDANRYTLLGRLLLAAQKGDDRVRVQKLNDDRSAFVGMDEPNPPSGADQPDPLPVIEPLKKDAALAAAESKRIDAAKDVAALLGKGQTVPDELARKLGDALFAEEEQYKHVFGAPPGQTSLTQKVVLAQARVNWLTIKYRVARKAFGISLVVEWEDAEKDIRADLAQAYENLNLLRTEQAAGLPRAQDVDLAQYYLMRRLVLAGRLGLYTDFDEGDLVGQLKDLTDQLIGSQPNAALRVKTDGSPGKYFYHLTNDDGWDGKPEATPAPKSAPARGTPTRRPSSTAAPTTGAAATARPSQAAATPQRTAPAATPVVPAGQAVTPVNTPVPAQPTNTPVPPAATNTPVPAPPTSTPPPAPPTATPARPYP